MQRLTYSLVYVLLLLGATTPPVEANTYLVFRKDKQTKRTDDRAAMIWHASSPPIAGKTCPAESTVIELPKEMKGKPIHELKRDGFTKIVHEPPVEAVPALTEDQKMEKEIRETLRATADDTTITDVQYARLLRISNMQDSAKKKAEWDKIKDGVKKKP